jgi:hypothetical protein
MDIRRLPLRAILKRRFIELVLFLMVTWLFLCKVTYYGGLVCIARKNDTNQRN